ncbi:MAG: APC family permease, partial [Promethearchaeota archaeon]
FIPVSVMGFVAAVLVGILIALNYIGIRESASLNIVFVILGLVGLVIVLLLGFTTVWSWAYMVGQIQWGVTPSFDHFFYAISVATVSFIGLESISEAAEETRNPGRIIPRTTLLLIACIIFFSVVVSILAVGVVPWQSLASGTADPMAVLALALPFGFIIAPFIAIIGITICYVSANSGIIGVSRVTYEMSRSNLLPQWFNKLHSEYRTPHRSIILFTAISIGLAFLGDLHFLVDLYSFGALISYMMVNLSMIRLRNSHPDDERPWRAPGSLRIPWRGGTSVEVPINAVIGFISCFAVWLIVVLFKPFGRIGGTLWFLIGLTLYVIYRKRRGLPLRSIKTDK